MKKHNSELRASNSEIQYTPPYTVSGKAMNLIAEIAAAVERYRIILEGPDGVRLRKINHVRTIRGTTAIEGNTLTEEQIMDICMALARISYETSRQGVDMVDLMECGAVDNSRKTTYPGKSVVGFMHGTKRQYDFVDGNMDMLFCRFSELVNIPNIAANDNMISINGAVSVDLTGQVSAESIGPRQYSGTGGQLDFVRGAALSKGGASFIAIPSTARTRSGVVSRIVPQLAPGSIVTTPRTDVQYVATEYGVARLQFCDVPERVRRLISISHPDYRDELTYAARQSGLLY